MATRKEVYTNFKHQKTECQGIQLNCMLLYFPFSNSKCTLAIKF